MIVKQDVMAIIDVGKTNKKLLLFNRQYEKVYEWSEKLPETVDEDGFPCEDVDLLPRAIYDLLDKAVKDDRFVICALHFTSYGASFVYLGENGHPVAPLYNYLKPFPDSLHNWFYNTYGSETKIARETASPILGNLNSGMQVLRLKHEGPEVWRNVKHALHLPQYLGYLFHKKTYTDITSIGCHTQLWNFDKQQYHDWVVSEGLDLKFGPIAPSDCVSMIDLADREIPCGVGLHDSSSALIPYLKSFTHPFVLVSTGTWSICLNPFNHTPLTAIELAQDCLCYLQYNGQPVKASRLFMGRIHDLAAAKIAQQFHVDADALPETHFIDNHYANALEIIDRYLFVDEIDWSDFSSATQAYHLLLLLLVREQVKKLELVLFGTNVEDIYVDGGFSKNRLFMNMLAKSLYPKRVYASEVAQATSLGAALALHHQWNASMPVQNLIQLVLY